MKLKEIISRPFVGAALAARVTGNDGYLMVAVMNNGKINSINIHP